jgi:hypothetical protein
MSLDQSNFDPPKASERWIYTGSIHIIYALSKITTFEHHKKSAIYVTPFSASLTTTF